MLENPLLLSDAHITHGSPVKDRLWSMFAWFLTEDECIHVTSELKAAHKQTTAGHVTADGTTDGGRIVDVIAFLGRMSAIRCGPQTSAELRQIGSWASMMHAAIDSLIAVRKADKALTRSDLCAAEAPSPGCCPAHDSKSEICRLEESVDSTIHCAPFAPELTDVSHITGTTQPRMLISARFPSGSVFPLDVTGAAHSSPYEILCCSPLELYAALSVSCEHVAQLVGSLTVLSTRS